MPRPDLQAPGRALPAGEATTAVVAAVFAAVFATALLCSSIVRAQDLPEAIGENWYRTEILVFVREDQESRSAQQFDPLPSLAYPLRYRNFIDPEVADRRLAESQAFASSIDSDGQQHLGVPAPVAEVLDHNRPDALVTDIMLPELIAEPETETAAGDPNAAISAEDAIAGLLPPDPNEPIPDPNAPVLALPYEFLGPQALSFGNEARSLRRQGQRVLFHETWWSELAEGDEPEWLLLDRSGDPDTLDWPSLQGALRVYRSRYLHAEVDIWLNTLGDYLPEGWQIPAPPLAMPSVHSATLGGEPINPWAPQTPDTVPDSASQTRVSAMADAAYPGAIESRMAEPRVGPSSVTGTVDEMNESLNEAAGEEQEHDSEPEKEDTVDYPWRHAIVHQQSRRMRSGEIHYLDHPVIGVIVRVTPASAEDLPLLGSDTVDFRERHALPAERITLEPPSDPSP
jgi:hypothetical protein